MGEVSFEDFQKLDMKVGRVIKVEPIPGAKALYRLIVDFGTERRQAVTGLARYYKPEELEGKEFAFILNLPPKKIFGVESNAMILAADDGVSIAILKPDKEVRVGAKIR